MIDVELNQALNRALADIKCGKYSSAAEFRAKYPHARELEMVLTALGPVRGAALMRGELR